MAAIQIACFATACGRLAFTPGVPDADAVDGSPDSPLGPFGSPTLLGVFTTVDDEDDPSLTADELEMYFERRTGGGDVFVATRASKTAPWTAGTAVTSINTAMKDGMPGVSADGLVLMFASDRSGGMGMDDIYVSTRGSRTDTWGAPVLVAELNSTQSDGAPALSGSGLEVVFQSDRAGGSGLRDLYLASRPDTLSAWNPPVRIAVAASPGEDVSGAFARNDLELWFSAPGTGGGVGEDLWRMTRADATAALGPPAPVGELNTASIEDDPWISEDGRTIYFSSNALGNFDIYVATR